VYSAETGKYQVLLYNYNNPVPQADQVDLAANVYTVAPNVWSWLEVPLYVHATGLGYPQFMLKADKPGTVFVDEVQVINAAPKLMSPRGDVKSHFAYGDWDKFSDFSGWGAEGGEFFVQDCGVGQLDLQLGRISQPTGTENKAKLTAVITPGGPIYTPRVTAGREVGTVGEVKAIYSGFTTLSSAVIVAAYGVATEGAYEIAGMEDVPNNFVATAQFGKIVPGPMYAIGVARNNWYQFQFIAKDIIPGGRISLGPIDFWSDADDPNFGDPGLYYK
jgi:hypothetical protein